MDNRENQQQPAQTRCEYCRELIEPGDLEMCSIYSRTYRDQGGKSKPRPHHKSKRCAGKDQMGHE